MPQIRQMTRTDLDTVLDWAAAEGWNPGNNDAAAFLAADPGGFLISTQNDQPVAAISVVRHAPNYAFLGLYICHPDFRGQGQGMAIWNAGISVANKGIIGLDGVVDQQENYQKSGFAATHRTIRHTGWITPKPDPEIQTAGPEHLPALLALDRRTQGVHRPRYLSAWFTQTPTRNTLILLHDGTPVGVGTIRDCRNGSKIGPIIADTPQTAQRLLHALATHAKPPALFIDVPDNNTAALSLVETFDFKPVFETARMYRGAPPVRRTDHIFAETTLELG